MIREGCLEDLDRCAEMGCQFWNTATAYEEEADYEHTREVIRECMQQGMLAVAEVDDELVGFVCAMKAPCLCTPAATIGVELAWWVDPDYRSAEIGKALMDKIEYLAKQAGVKYFNMAVMEASDPEVGERIYVKRGYAKNETTYMRVL